MAEMRALEQFHPLIQAWFTRRFDTPTPAQEQAWPSIGRGEHVLVTAPTGSGKTLTAFLWAIDQLVKGAWSGGAIRVLYISPLRALNNDIRRNLVTPLGELASEFRARGETAPRVRIATRSGDTPQSERRRMLRHPPEILITTPESLNILLTSQGGLQLFRRLETVVLDEVHAVAASKRGVHLITAVERLTRLSGEFQRVALSATVRPLDRIARWVGGYRMISGAETPTYEPRPVTVIDAGQRKEQELSVSYCPAPAETREAHASGGSPVWQVLADEIAGRLGETGSTLVFANSRRVVERMARLINDAAGHQAVYSHHGSLSREIREVVEARLKAGELSGIVATSSLELGIDVGAIDEVILVGTPPSVASTVQRLGRAGHSVGETSRGQIYAVHAQDVLDAAVVARAVRDRAIEPLSPPEAPLDVLAQVILSMVATEEWKAAALFGFLKASDPYHHLARPLFDLVIEMLAGRYAGTRLSELRPRIDVDRVDETIRARPGATLLLYGSGGTIPDRGTFRVKLADTRAVVGELDEEFVWERTVGETLTLGVQAWRIESIGSSDVIVTPAERRAAMTPFWKFEGFATSPWLAERRARFLAEAEERIEDVAFAMELHETYRLDEPAVRELIRFLQSQRQATGCALPHARHLVIEEVPAAPGGGGRHLVIFHTQWGGRVNRPLGLALRAHLEQRHRLAAHAMTDEGCVALELPEAISGREVLAEVQREDLERLVRMHLEATGFFGARFRENAGRALLLQRSGFGRRTPLWLNRQRAKELKRAVEPYADFPILLETYRTCLRDEFDLPALHDRLDRVAAGEVAVSEVTCEAPSPFAAEIIWRRTNELMYASDAPGRSPLEMRADLIEEIVRASHLRPRVPPALVAQLRGKLQRIAPGYAPPGAQELIEHVKECVLIEPEVWHELLGAMERDHDLCREEVLEGIGARVIGVDGRFVCAIENLAWIRRALGLSDPRLGAAALDGSPTSSEAREALARLRDPPVPDEPLVALLRGTLRHDGPRTRSDLERALGRPVDSALAQLHEDGGVILDEITDGAREPEVCDARNLAWLLRLMRTAAQPAVEPLPPDALAPFLARQQRLGRAKALPDVMERLFGYLAADRLWEEEILPARLMPYRASWLDQLVAETELQWYGQGERRVFFAPASEWDLYGDGSTEGTSDDDLLPHIPGRFSLEDLLARRPGADSGDLTRSLWDLTWRGRVTNDSPAALREAIASGFRFREPPARRPPAGRRVRARFSDWRARRAFTGVWFRVPDCSDSADPVEEEERNRERARVLLDRYGILFRELVAREVPALQWRRLFRTLRVLELGGEVIGGHFFSGIRGLQFIAPALLERGGETRIWWVNATDPASPCGLSLEGLDLPHRVVTTHLVFRGRELVVVSRRRGRRLEIRTEPGDRDLGELLGFLNIQLTREVRPRRSILVEEINGRPASSSPFRAALERRFDVSGDHHRIRLMRRFDRPGDRG